VTAGPSRVLVVDDDARVRAALSRLIRAAGYAVETFGSAREFLARPPHEGPACLVLDLRMPEVDGLELQEVLRQVPGAMPVIFLTGHADVQSSVRAMKGGAVDFLLKPVEDDQLLDAIARALGRHAAALAAEAERRAARVRWDRLTPREREVCALVAQGMLNKQIAGVLGTVEKTVKVHRARVMGKLEVDSVAALVRLFDQVRSGGRGEGPLPSAGRPTSSSPANRTI
jgi:FixJ family two-component response regulator